MKSARTILFRTAFLVAGSLLTGSLANAGNSCLFMQQAGSAMKTVAGTNPAKSLTAAQKESACKTFCANTEKAKGAALKTNLQCRLNNVVLYQKAKTKDPFPLNCSLNDKNYVHYDKQYCMILEKRNGWEQSGLPQAFRTKLPQVISCADANKRLFAKSCRWVTPIYKKSI